MTDPVSFREFLFRQPVRATRFSYNAVFLVGAVIGWAVGHWLL